jgi:putative phage-type endonuclease
MDVFDILVDKYTKIMIDYHKKGEVDIYNKIELLIQNDTDYNSLDNLEKSIMLNILKDTRELKMNFDNNPVSIVNSTPKSIVNSTTDIDKKVISKKIWSVNTNTKKEEGGSDSKKDERGSDGKKEEGSDGKKEYKKSAFDLSKLLSKKKYEPYNSNATTSTPPATATTATTNITGIIEPITDNDYDNRKNIFTALSEIVLPAQRSEAWFKMRSEKITASDCGTVLGQNKYEPVYSFLIKKVFGSTFETNDACYHGKKFENIVTLMYEYKYDTCVHEFGLLGHPEHTILGASPDGICGPYKRDGKTRSELVGRMLEIKCPIFRKIKYSGEVKGEICPIYYWCQVQQQLECCNLDECDFVQVNIEEIDRDEYLKDCKSDTEEYISKKTGLEKGALLEFIPTKISDDDIDIKTGSVKMSLIYDKASFIYPPKIDMSNSEIDKWILSELDKKRDDVKLNRVIYWRILESSNTLILRDRAWFNENLPRLKEIWSYVEFLRNNMSIANEWKTYIDSLPKKYSDKIMDKLYTLKSLMKEHK